jgi:hypothetical protein
MYKKMKERYETQVLMPELERRKEEIAKKRELYRPLNHDEICEHAKRYESAARELAEKREKARKARYLEHHLTAAAIPKGRSSLAASKALLTNPAIEEE